MAEWTIATVLKTVLREIVTWVRIPPHPLRRLDMSSAPGCSLCKASRPSSFLCRSIAIVGCAKCNATFLACPAKSMSAPDSGKRRRSSACRRRVKQMPRGGTIHCLGTPEINVRRGRFNKRWNDYRLLLGSRALRLAEQACSLSGNASPFDGAA